MNEMLGDALRNVCGPLGDLCQKLSGPNREEWLTAFKKFLRKENPWDKLAFPIFRSISLGTHDTIDSLKETLAREGTRGSVNAARMLWGLNFARKQTEVKLITQTVAELGFPNGARYDAICDRAKALDLNLCPAEVGPQLRLQYKDQPRDDTLIIAMKPITWGSGDYKYLFIVSHCGTELWLDSKCYISRISWNRNDRFVFCRQAPKHS